MSNLDKFKGKSVSVKGTGATGIIKEVIPGKGTSGVRAVTYLVELSDGQELKLRPDEITFNT